MSDAVHEGGCLCGAVRYAARGPALLTEYCHCGMCRKAAGAPVVAWADFPAAQVTWTRGAPRWRRSSPGAERGFCAECGSALAFRRIGNTVKVTLTLGSLDEPARLPPAQHIFTDDRVPWLEIADDLPRYGQARPEP